MWNCCVLFIASSALINFCPKLHSVGALLLGRFVAGLASGLATSTVPMYMAECAPLALRGTFAVLTSMGEFNHHHHLHRTCYFWKYTRKSRFEMQKPADH